MFVYFRSLAKIEEVRRATKRVAPNDRDAFYADRKRLSVDGSMRYESSSRFVDSKSNGGSTGFGSGSSSLANDYRGSKISDPARGGGYDGHPRRFERQNASTAVGTGVVGGGGIGASSSVVTRRVVQEVSSLRRDTRPAQPPSPPQPNRDRLEDRRVIDRAREDR